MKKIIYVILCTVCLTVSNNLKTKNLSIHQKELLYENLITITFSYELVFKDGIWWVYVYDEDGRLVNTYPFDE
ncbi:MAG: hypothetical protein JSS91_09085 [Bacteroidetes bacterium]|nr:hypothetical protein [Bacteroidota bacterium]